MAQQRHSAEQETWALQEQQLDEETAMAQAENQRAREALDADRRRLVEGLADAKEELAKAGGLITAE